MKEQYIDAIWADYTIHGEVVTLSDAMQNELNKIKFKLDHGTYRMRQKVKKAVDDIPGYVYVYAVDAGIIALEVILGKKFGVKFK